MAKPKEDHPWNRRLVFETKHPGISKMIRDGRRVRSIADEAREQEIAKALRGDDIMRRESEGFEALGISDGSHVSIGDGGYQRKAHRYG